MRGARRRGCRCGHLAHSRNHAAAARGLWIVDDNLAEPACGSKTRAGAPPEILAIKIDRLSIDMLGWERRYVWLAYILIVVALTRSHLRNASRRWLGIGLTSLPLLAWGALFPAVLHGPDGLMDAASAQAILGDIAEMQAVQDFSEATLYLLPGTIAVVYAAIRAIRTRSLNWGYGSVIGLVCVGSVHGISALRCIQPA